MGEIFRGKIPRGWVRRPTRHDGSSSPHTRLRVAESPRWCETIVRAFDCGPAHRPGCRRLAKHRDDGPARVRDPPIPLHDGTPEPMTAREVFGCTKGRFRRWQRAFAVPPAFRGG